MAVCEKSIGDGFRKHLQFRAIVEKTSVYAAFAQDSLQFTLFAPNNTAMRSVPERVLDSFTATTKTAQSRREDVALYHTVQSFGTNEGAPYRVEDLGDTVLSSLASNSPRLFFRRLMRNGKMVQFVNGAEIMESVEANNGVVHIIGGFLHQVATKSTALSFLSDQAEERYEEISTRKFRDIVAASRDYLDTPYDILNSDDSFVTLFAPTDRALAHFKVEELSRLKSNTFQLVKLLRRHVIANVPGGEPSGVRAVNHGAVLEEIRKEALRTSGVLPEIPALEGFIKPLSVNNELYVTNTCGRVKVLSSHQFDPFRFIRPVDDVPVTANQTVNNGVVHLVDGLLGYIYNDVYGTLREEKRASAMAAHVARAPDKWADRLRLFAGTVLKPEERITVFVPINQAFYDVENAEDMIHFTNNITYVIEVLNLHIVRGQHSLTDIVNGSSLPTLASGHIAKFTTWGDYSYVTVDHIVGRIVVPDICVENGIIHYVDAVLGVPYLTIFEYINRDTGLRNLYQYVRRAGLENVLKNVRRPVTFFAPNHEAFEKMKETVVGRELLASNSESEGKLQKVLLAHTVSGFFYLSEMKSDEYRFPNSQLRIIREGNDYVIERRGEFQTIYARIGRQDLRMTSGVLHLIDQVLYEDSQAALRAIPVSAAPPRGSHRTAAIVHLVAVLLTIVNQVIPTY